MRFGNEEAFFERYKDVADVVRAIQYCQGYCYTQLTDVEPEEQRPSDPERTPKIGPNRFRALIKESPGKE